VPGKCIDSAEQCDVYGAQVAPGIEDYIKPDAEGGQLDPARVERLIVTVVLQMRAIAQVENSNGFKFPFDERKISVDAIKIVQVCIDTNAVHEIKSTLGNLRQCNVKFCGSALLMYSATAGHEQHEKYQHERSSAA
jgi:hypothetical protein